jgi:hypothetical protein
MKKFSYFLAPLRRAKLLLAGCLLSALTPYLSTAQYVPSALGIETSGSTDEGVTAGVKVYNSLHTGAAVKGIWRGEQEDVLEAFCWDDVAGSASSVGVNWRYRRQVDNPGLSSPSSTECTSSPVGFPCLMQTLSIGNSQLIEEAYDPDVTIGIRGRELDDVPDFSCVGPANYPMATIDGVYGPDNRGYGVFFLVVGYQTKVDSMSSYAMVNIYLVRDPYSGAPTNPIFLANPGCSPGPSYELVSVKQLDKGYHVNVDMAHGNNFSVTWTTPSGAIMGQIGVLPTINSDGTVATPQPWYDPFVVATPQSADERYWQPDVASVNVINQSSSHTYTYSMVAFTYIREVLTPSGPQPSAQTLMLSTSPYVGSSLTLVGPLDTRELHTPVDGQLRRPRITLGLVRYDSLGAPTKPPYVVVFEEHTQVNSSCDVEVEGGKLHAISDVRGNVGSLPLVRNVYSPSNSRHVNQCLLRVSNTEPVVASMDPGAGSVALWTSKGGDDPNDNSILDDQDILAHNLMSSGVGRGRLTGSTSSYYPTGGTHYRVNRTVKGPQRAPSIATAVSLRRIVTAWYDAVDNMVYSHDDAEYITADHSPRYRVASGGTTTSFPTPMTSRMTLTPNPTDLGGVLDIELAPTERITTLLVTELTSGKTVVETKGRTLPAALQEGQRLHVPLKKLLPASLQRGLYIVKVTTTARTYTTRLAFEPTGK